MSPTFVQSITTGLLQGSIYALIGLGLYLVFSVMKVVNFAHGHLVLLGMYGVLLLDPTNLGTYVLSIVVVAFAAAVFGYLMQWALIESGMSDPGHSQLVITLSVGLVLQYIFQVAFPVPFQKITNPYPWAESIRFAGVTINSGRLVAGIASILLAGAVSYAVYRTKPGQALRACSDNLRGALHTGVNVPKTFRYTSALGAALAATAGALLIPFQAVAPTLGLDFAIKAFIVVVIGGIGSVWGTFMAGIILGLTESLGSVYAPGSVALAVVYLMFFVIVLVMPDGLTKKVYS